ncbi:putative ATPase [Rubidibacter lacunae KORDI 51-2]|uniref:Putative ATPase n=1 Tax=Rubidibacter lacunae KORDI 51-2 TaxID=582515 RepID=U5DJD3_9CHRO|nr:ATP-binding protein [Rubidibacter lacunae]ERN41037.1 putative ATPase [Rubidibacter lacunae KORDI 51-2]
MIESELSPPQLELAMANAISISLLYTLGRKYLDIPLDKGKYIRPESPLARSSESFDGIEFLRLEMVGDSSDSLFNDPLMALQTALASCHHPKHCTLIFIVSSDGNNTHIYLGIRRSDHTDYLTKDFVKNVGNFLEGNWSGTKLVPCYPESSEFQTRIINPLNKNLRYINALTGIPSLKAGENPGYPQSLDRLITGLRGSPFMYMIVAEPMDQGDVNQAIHQLRELMGRVHSLSKVTSNETFSENISEALGRTESFGKSVADGINFNEAQSDQKIKDIINLVSAGTLAVGAFFPPAELLIEVGLGALLLKDFTPTKQKSSGMSSTITDSFGESLSTTTTLGKGLARAFGREYINTHAEAAKRIVERYLNRFEESRALGCWNVGIYLLAEEPNVAQQGAIQLKALLSGEQSFFEPIRVHNLSPGNGEGWRHAVRKALQEFCQPSLTLVTPNNQTPLVHPLGTPFNHLTTPLNVKELALLVNIPQREIPGVKVMASASFSLNPPTIEDNDIILGYLLEGGKQTGLNYGIPKKTLAKHGLVTGITGSGKTSTCQKLLSELHQEKIPLLVIEPAKTEYVDWAMELNKTLPQEKHIAVYMPGVKTWRGIVLKEQLVLNPFDVVWLHNNTPQVLPHIDRLKSILNAAFPMQEVLPIILEELIFDAYNHHGWLDDELPPLSTSRPTFSQLRNKVGDVVKSLGYETKITANLTAALTARIQSFRRGWKKQLFDRTPSTKWNKIFDRPAIINLSHLGDDADKAFTMAILLNFLYEYRQAQYELGIKQQPLFHLTVIEEAHRILSNVRASSLEQASPQGKVAEMFSNILSEIRAYGEGFLIVDQVPSRLIPDVVKNTNLKIVHRLVASDDRDSMSTAMALTLEQTNIINRLRPGQSIIYGEQDDLAAWVQISK